MTEKILPTIIHDKDSQSHLCEFIVKQNETFYQKVFNADVDFSRFKQKLMESDLSSAEHLFMINLESLGDEKLNCKFEQMFDFKDKNEKFFKECKEVNEKREKGDYLFCLSRKVVNGFGKNFMTFRERKLLEMFYKFHHNSTLFELMNNQIIVCQGTNIYKKNEKKIIYPYITHIDNKSKYFYGEVEASVFNKYLGNYYNGKTQIIYN